MMVIGTLVAWDKESGLKTVFHVEKAAGTVKFVRAPVIEFSHTCHPSVRNTASGYVKELGVIENGRFADCEFFEKRIFSK